MITINNNSDGTSTKLQQRRLACRVIVRTRIIAAILCCMSAVILLSIRQSQIGTNNKNKHSKVETSTTTVENDYRTAIYYSERVEAMCMCSRATLPLTRRHYASDLKITKARAKTRKILPLF